MQYRVDHIVLTVRSVDETSDFYTRCLGFERVDRAGLPTSLRFGTHRINLHQSDDTFSPRAARPTVGSADYCLITDEPLASLCARLSEQGVAIELGPVQRHGTLGPIMSVYFRDPDGNLVEVSQEV